MTNSKKKPVKSKTIKNNLQSRKDVIDDKEELYRLKEQLERKKEIDRLKKKLENKSSSRKKTTTKRPSSSNKQEKKPESKLKKLGKGLGLVGVLGTAVGLAYKHGLFDKLLKTLKPGQETPTTPTTRTPTTPTTPTNGNMLEAASKILKKTIDEIKKGLTDGDKRELMKNGIDVSLVEKEM